MKSFIKKAACVAAVIISIASCDALWEKDPSGQLKVSFDPEMYARTKAAADIPDTNNFILTVTNSKGSVIYTGTYGASPETIMVSPGTYTISVVSSQFSTPKFSSPQYGDTQTATVTTGKAANVLLLCRQTNAGVRLKIASTFLTAFPKGSLFLKNNDGKLLYSYSEKRIAYFRPGAVSLMMSNEGKDEVLLTRNLEARDMLTLNISTASTSSTTGGTGGGTGGSGGTSSGGSSPTEIIRVQVDTSRNWLTENYTIGSGSGSGGSGKGGSQANAMSVSEARSSAGSEDVWVYGYIVGGDLTSGGASFTAPFSSRTNIVIAARSSTTDKQACLSVQLQKGDIRDELNLVDNESNLGRQVFLCGDIVESYYGIPGIQNITEYELK